MHKSNAFDGQRQALANAHAHGRQAFAAAGFSN
jgi:hypothetical protein